MATARPLFLKRKPAGGRSHGGLTSRLLEWLLSGEAIEQAVAAGRDQGRLGAAPRRGGRVSGTCSFHIGLDILGTLDRRIALAVSVSKHGDTNAAAGPVVASQVHVGQEG